MTLWYRLSKIYVGQTQVRPKPWFTPWANTLAYLKLENDANDSSWNSHNGTASNITYTTLSTWKKVATFAGNSTIVLNSSLFSSWVFTCNIYVYWTWFGTSELNVIMWNANSDSQWYYSDHYWGTLRWCVNNTIIQNTGYVTDTWFLYTITHDGSTIRMYKNWSLLTTVSYSWTTYTVRNFYLWYRAYGNDRYWKWYMSEFICENRVWSDADISAYYNKTKWNYWL